MNLPKLELVSFDICPYVQRAIITLKHKNIPFTFKEIDLDSPPEWFLKISPAGRVPVLLVQEQNSDEKTAIFESAVINEYLDEITEPHLMPTQPLARAHERAWIAYASELFMTSYTLAHETDEAKATETRNELFDDISKLESALSTGPYFNGESFSLVDTSFAPFFLRLSFSNQLWSHPAWKQMPKTRKWAEALLEHPAVRASTTETLQRDYIEYIQEFNPTYFA